MVITFTLNKTGRSAIARFEMGGVTANCGMQQLSTFFGQILEEGLNAWGGRSPAVLTKELIEDFFESLFVHPQFIAQIQKDIVVLSSRFLGPDPEVLANNIEHTSSFIGTTSLMQYIMRGDHGSYVTSPLVKNNNYTSHGIMAIMWMPNFQRMQGKLCSSTVGTCIDTKQVMGTRATLRRSATKFWDYISKRDWYHEKRE